MTGEGNSFYLGAAEQSKPLMADLPKAFKLEPKKEILNWIKRKREVVY